GGGCGGGRGEGGALAGAGPRLCHEVLARRKRSLDGGRERGLLAPRLEPGQDGGERAAGTKGVVHSDTRLRMRTDVLRPGSRPLTKMSARCEFSPAGAVDRSRAPVYFRPSDPGSLRA